jgi:hypothetical protein
MNVEQAMKRVIHEATFHGIENIAMQAQRQRAILVNKYKVAFSWNNSQANDLIDIIVSTYYDLKHRN